MPGRKRETNKNIPWEDEVLICQKETQTRLLELIGRKSSSARSSKELLFQLLSTLASFSSMLAREKDLPNRKDLQAISHFQNTLAELQRAFKKLPDRIKKDLIYSQVEETFINSIEKRIFRQYHLDYPPKVSYPGSSEQESPIVEQESPIIEKESPIIEKEPPIIEKDVPLSDRIIMKLHPSRSHDFLISWRLFSRFRSATKRLKQKYKTTSKRGGRTRRSETEIEEQVFELFDTYWKGDSSHFDDGTIDPAYVNRKVEFTELAMRAGGIRTLGLGTKGRNRVYSGRLGQNAYKHCRNGAYWAALKEYKREGATKLAKVDKTFET